MSILANLFGAKPQNAPLPNQQQQVQAPVAPPVSNNPANNPAPTGTVQTPGTAPNGVVPADGSAESPLKQFETIWQPTPVDPNAKPDPTTQLTPEHFMEAAGKVDFTKVISAEDMAKIQAGGQDALTTLVSALNKTSQVVMGQTLAGANKLIDKRVNEAKESFNKNIPRTVRDQNVREALITKNEMLKNPAVAPVVVAMQQQISEKFPHASEAEILEMAQSMVLGVGNAMAPAPKQETPKVSKEYDWSDL